MRPLRHPDALARAHSTQARLESVSRACTLLRTFADGGEKLTLAEMVKRTGLEKTIVFRLLHTLEVEGFLRNVGGHQYCSNIKIAQGKPFRIGYAAAGPYSFSVAVTEGLRWAAARNDVDLILLDNQTSPRTALRNAERLIADRVDLAIEFQENSNIAPLISSLFHKAGIPLIAVGTPHPGATFFGIDNYRVGRAAGRLLYNWVKENWQGQTDELVLLGEDSSGSLPRLRLSGVEDVLRETVPALRRTQYLDARGKLSLSFDLVRRHLRFNPARRILIAGINDEVVLGGLQAFAESGRSGSCVAVALGGTAQARLELRAPGTCLLACIAFFPERYGDVLIRLALEILHRRPVPQAVHPEVHVITKDNVYRFYPSDKPEYSRDFFLC